MSGLYLDNAATSFPKPPEVGARVAAYLAENGAPAGRGGYRRAMEVGRVIEQCRGDLARLFHTPDPRYVVFTLNGTDSLNTAILGLCRTGDHLVSSIWEHNSVLRPLKHLQAKRGVEFTLLEPDDQGLISPDALRTALRPHTRLVALQHANNVIGVIQPLADLAAVTREQGAFFLVDAAQTAGHVEVDLSTTPIDLLATSGHKGLLGPLGTGVLVLSPRVVDELSPFRFGGTGTQSELDLQPTTLPEKYESGNHNVPGLVGLAAALQWSRANPLAARRRHEIELTNRLWEGLAAITGVQRFGPNPADVARVGIVSLSVEGYSPQDLATILDEHFDIAARAGLHCAPGVHRSLGTSGHGGTLRLSVGAFTTAAEIDHVVAAIRSIAMIS
jgi:cysteine desulfurase family protein